MVEKATEVFVLFLGMLVEFVLARKATEATLAVIEWAAILTVLQVYCLNMTCEVTLSEERQVATVMGTPMVFDVRLEMLSQCGQILECFTRFLQTTAIPLAMK